MIVQIQGASGAGKSTLARLLMGHLEKLGAEREVLRAKDGRVLGYGFHLWRRQRERSLYFVGKYETPCGGCDQVGSSAEVARRVRMWADKGDVLFEGLLLSGGQGSLGRYMLGYGPRFAYAFLDTPLEKCLKRVQARRDARARKRGLKRGEPLNPKNTTSKWRACQRYVEKAKALGYRVEVLGHRDPLPGLLKLLGWPR
jgi:hypothetical protein